MSVPGGETSSEGDAIKVFVRVRPPESGNDCHACLEVAPGQNAIIMNAKPEQKVFTYDHVADSDCSQESVFSTVGRKIIDSCVEGYNGTIFAYGQTGSGKTFTMLGPSEDSDNFQHELRGVIPRSFEYLFNIIDHQKQMNDTDFLCKCSFLEIYNEQVFDLLDTSSPSLNLRENIKRGVYADGLIEVAVTNASEAYQVLTNGWLNRRVASTSMNRESSRSHAVFTVQVESKEIKGGVKNVRSSLLNLVDLAGSERQKDTKSDGQRLKEAGSINKSLSTLGNVIMSLVDIAHGKSRYVPYRDSKLSFLLRDSLGGNAKTCIIGCVHPSAKCFGETLSTLGFVRRAKMIKNKASVNEDTSGNVMLLQAEIKKLKESLLQYQSGQMVVEPTAAPSVSADCSLWQRYFQHAMLFRERSIQDQQALHEKVGSMEDICNKKEKCLQSTKMIIKFRESHISRLEKQLKEKNVTFDEVTQSIVEDLKHEIEILKAQVNHNPLVTKYAMENQALRTELKNLKGQKYFICQQDVDNNRLLELEESFKKLSASAAPSSESETLYSTPQTGDNNVAVATVQKYKSQINSLQSQIDSLKQELSEQTEVSKRQQAEMEGKLTSHKKTISDMEKILEAQQLSSMVERKSLNDLHMQTIMTITTPKKTAYELRNRTVVAPSLDGSFIGEDDAFLITEEDAPDQLTELAQEALTEEIKQLNERNSELQRESVSKDQEIVALRQKQSEVEHTAQHVGESHSAALQNIADLQKQVENISTALAETMQHESALQFEVRDLKIVLEASEKELKSVKAKKKEVSETQQQEIETMSTKIIRIEADLLTLQRQNDIMQNEKEMLQENIDMTQMTLNFKEEQMSLVEEQLANERKQKAEDEKTLQHYMDKLDQEKQVTAALTSQLHDVGMEKDKQVLNTLEELEIIRQEKYNIEENLVRVEDDFKLATQEGEKARQGLVKSEKELLESKDALSKLMADIQKLKTNKMMQDEDVEDLTLQLEEKSKENETLQQIIGDHVKNIDEKEKQLDALAALKEQELAVLSKENLKLSDERDNFHESMVQSLSELERAHAEVKNKECSIQQLNEQIQANAQEVDHMKKDFENKLAKAQLQAQERENDEKDIQLEKQGSELEEYKTTCSTLKESLNKVQAILQEKRSENKQLQSEIEESKKYRAEVENLTLQCSQLEELLEKRKEEDQSKDEKLMKYEESNKMAELRENELKQEKTRLEYEFATVTAQHEHLVGDMQELESSNQRLRLNLDNAYLKATEMKHEIDEVREQKSKIEKELKGNEDTMERLRVENAKLVGHQNHHQKIQLHLKIKEENSTLREDNVKLRAEINKLQRKKLHESTLKENVNPVA